jgi:hypothetical protein
VRYIVQIEWVSAVICDFLAAIFGTLDPNAAGIIVVKVLKISSPKKDEVGDEVGPNKMYEVIGE